MTQAVLAGVFGALSDEPVNLVNARAVAEGRGIEVGEERTRTPGDYTNLVRVACGGETSVAGTTIGREQRPWLVEVDGYRVEIELAPAHLLVMMNDDSAGHDRPGRDAVRRRGRQHLEHEREPQRPGHAAR